MQRIDYWVLRAGMLFSALALLLYVFSFLKEDFVDRKLDMTPDYIKREDRPKATSVLLIKSDNESVSDAAKMLRGFDKAFNLKYQYPITIFHEKDLTKAFKYQLRDAVTSVQLDFVRVDFELPSWINISSVPETVGSFDEQFLYMGYRHMCRFFSGEVFKHEALAKYDYYWRLDDDSNYICEVNYDPFSVMRKHHLKYGWLIYFFEYPEIAGNTLFDTTLKYIKENDIEVSPRFADLKTAGGSYHRCHYWNNFEIVDLNFFRGKEYQNYYNYLDKLGGFYFYRWGDALVRTLAVDMFLKNNEVFRFDIGYDHQSSCYKECNQTVDCEHFPNGIHKKCQYLQRTFRGVETHHVVLVILGVAAAVGLPIYSRRRKTKSGKTS